MIDCQTESVSLLCALLRAPSFSGEEDRAAEVLQNAMCRLGYDDVAVDENGSVIGTLYGTGEGPAVLFDGHIDTVRINDPSLWHHDPFGAEEEDGRIYGRGASDMKGAVAAMTVAAAAFAEKTQRRFPGKICVAGTVYEELFEGVSCRAISRRVRPDFVVIGESTQLRLNVGQRGRAEVVVETKGRSAHSANPEKGVNAVKKMAKLLTVLEDAYRAPEHPLLGRGILEVTDVVSAPYPGSSVLPETCTATFDRRLLAGETPESVLAPLNALIGRMRELDPEFEARAYLRSAALPCYTGGTIESERFFPAWLFDASEPYIVHARQALRAAGQKAELSAYSFCTNGSHYAGEAGIRTLGYGPSLENLAHTVDEYITREQLLKSCEGYQALCGSLTSESV